MNAQDSAAALLHAFSLCTFVLDLQYILLHYFMYWFISIAFVKPREVVEIL